MKQLWFLERNRSKWEKICANAYHATGFSRRTANAFCGVEPKAGQHFTKVTPDRSSPQFADYLLEIAEPYPEADTIHLVLDNLSSPTRKALAKRFGEKPGGWL